MSMYQAVDELERMLQQLESEQAKLLELLSKQRLALRALDVKSLESLTEELERSRLRIAATEPRRRMLALAAAQALRLPGAGEAVGLTRLAAAVLDQTRRHRLLGLRERLRRQAEAIERARAVNGRLVSALLGHLNTSVRLLVSAGSDAGTYTRSGTPRMTGAALHGGALETVG
ncbi:MAG: flagellar export chaperone FlgN [Tepidisphaerales bacterium]